ncbi:protein transport protein HofC [Enterobacter sp. Bisph1]|uniref:protein transport protein HofC n=1 Tax=Enterobacter sp. Bisph1 TaxID=1274399 RepID=UPI00057C1C12|nr:protein transport protein HofC [Enterobacter sp. Bisph1]
MASKQLWHWSGLTRSGELQSGLYWSENRTATVLLLYQQHIHPLSLKRCPIRRALWKAEYSSPLLHQLATLLRAGLTLPEGLELLAEQHEARQWRALLHHLAQALEQGETFCDALRQWPEVFPPLWLAMIRTGELTGKLEECCFKLAEQQKAERELAQKVKKALRYPSIILALTAAVVVAMIYLVLPEFTAIYQTFNTPLPGLTRGVIASADIMQRAALPLAIAAIIAGGALHMLRNHADWQRYKQRWILVSPIIGPLVRGQRLSQIFTVLALTQRAGIAFLQGLESVIETLTCPYWRAVLQRAHRQITEGEAISAALKESGEFPPLCIQLIRTGEVSGALDSMLENLAQHHSEQTHLLADSLAAVLEPLLLVITGLVIGVLVVAMYLPIFHLGDAMGAGG